MRLARLQLLRGERGGGKATLVRSNCPLSARCLVHACCWKEWLTDSLSIC